MGLVGALATIGSTAITNKTNYSLQEMANAQNLQMTRETNEANLQAVRETNSMQKQLADLGYYRSLPSQQLSNLMAAGMNKSAALRALQGGGTYTMPTLQTATQNAGHVDAAHMENPNIGQFLERMADIPSNVNQFKLQQAQLAAAEQQLQIAKNREEREQQQFEYDLWNKQYGKDTASKLDSASSLVANALLDSGKDISNFNSPEHMIRSLGLSNSPEIRNLPHLAREQMYDAIRNKFAEGRNQLEEQRKQTAADDVHDAAKWNRLLSAIEYDEKKKSLVAKLAILNNQLELLNYQVDDAKKNAILRDAGFQNEKEAAAAISAAENLEAEVRKSKAQFISQRKDNAVSKLAYGLEFLIDKLSPFKNLLSTK